MFQRVAQGLSPGEFCTSLDIEEREKVFVSQNLDLGSEESNCQKEFG